MKLNINKIIILSMVAASLVSCRITKYHEYSQNIPLETMSDKLVCDYVISPVTVLRTGFAFEDYLGKTEEEMLKDGLFYGRVKILGENSYRIQTGWICMNVALDSSGRSLREDGCSWKIGLYYVASFYGGSRSYDEPVYEATLSKETGTDVWVLESDNARTTIHYEIGTDDICRWIVGTQGREAYSNGVSISFATFGDMSFIKQFSIYDDLNENVAFSGQFNYKVYKDDEEMDHCYATYSAGFATDYQTSR